MPIIYEELFTKDQFGFSKALIVQLTDIWSINSNILMKENVTLCIWTYYFYKEICISS